MKLLSAVLLVTCTIVFGHAARADAGFKRCEVAQKFADCTVAKCDPKTFVCRCYVTEDVKSGVSNPPGCIAPTVVTATSPATAQSHYSPVRTTGLCSNQTTTWAQCLGVVCTVSADGKHASCPCTPTSAAASGGGSYVIVTKDPVYRGQCKSTILYSSATYDADVEQISKALDFKKPHVLWSH
jgi:hypothetical protein